MAITKEYLVAVLTKPYDVEFIKELSQEVISEKASIVLLYELCFDKSRRLSFRSAWVLEKVILSDTLCALPILSQFLDDFNKIPNEAVARHFFKIQANLLHLQSRNKLPKEISHIIDCSQENIIIEGCFKFLLDKKCAIAPKGWALDILPYYVARHSWIREELIFIINEMMLKARPSAKVFYRRLIQKIEN